MWQMSCLALNEMLLLLTLHMFLIRKSFPEMLQDLSHTSHYLVDPLEWRFHSSSLLQLLDY